MINEIEIWKIFISLGVPGLALGILFMLFRRLDFKFSKVPSKWVGPIVVLFLIIIAIIVFYTLKLWKPTNANENSSRAEECLPDSPPKNVNDALSKLNLPSNASLKASKVGDWGWKFEWAAGERYKLKLPPCVCVDYNQRSSGISGEIWKEKKAPEWTRALISKKGGSLNTPGGATIYWAECERYR